ncbi:hypothetical protein AB833_16220 [Chromatiales bacterium (ex Bugula neritina AB1)]|nr:hypothetical protein AB833_16220 [Chromatiales bacterium (ex Bugula neritina AB1)]
MKQTIKSALTTVIAATFILTTGCATITSGPDQAVQIDSTPADAVIKINNITVGKTPAMVDLKRSQRTATVELELPGFQPEKIVLKRGLNGWVWGNILLGGIIGVVVDVSTGAMYAHKLPESEGLVEIPASSKTKPEGADIWIDVTLKPMPELTKIGQLTPVS